MLTHPLLDAHTAYGTQLLWPLTTPPVMWSTLFIIDPLYTLPLIVGLVIAAVWPTLPRSDTALRAALAVSTLYIGWSWAGKQIVENNAREALANMGLTDAPVFSTPTPFNTLLWRVVAMTDDGYLEGFDSLLVSEPAMRFTAYPTDNVAMSAASDIWAVQRLRWFASDFVAARMDGETLLMDDLRMGQSPYFVFTHAVATRGNPHFTAIPTELVEFSFENRALAETWQRIWADPGPVDNF